MGAPEDRFHFVYVALLFLGMGMLFAYNSFIASPNYVNNYYKYASGDMDYNTTMPNVWKNAEQTVTVSIMVPNLLGQCFVVTKYGQRLPLRTRLHISSVLLAATIAIVVIVPAFKVRERAAFAWLLTASAVSGLTTAFFQASVFSLAAYFPLKYMQGTMLGIGISGLTCSLLQIITMSILSGQQQANLFFGIGIGWMMLCLVLIIFMPCNAFVRYYVPEFAVAGAAHAEPGERTALLDDDEEKAATYDGATPSTEGATPGAQKQFAKDEQPVDGEDRVEQSVDLVCLMKRIWPLWVANFLVYGVSLLVFPGLGAMIDNDAWFQVLIIFMFNLGDTCARFINGFEFARSPGRFLLPYSVVRFVFIPLFIICVHPKVIHGRALPYIFMLLTGLTNGYTSSLCMMYVPSMPTLANWERATAGAAMSLSLLSGCSVGSMLGLLVTSQLGSH